jgi:hypothetical protein
MGSAVTRTRCRCHTEFEKKLADFLDRAPDVARYFKNERFGCSITYYEGNRPRQYYPDFIVVGRSSDGRAVTWLTETSGEIRANTALKWESAKLWCEKMSQTRYGIWRHVLLQQKKLEAALAGGAKNLDDIASSIATP